MTETDHSRGGLLRACDAADYLATTERHLRRLVAGGGLAVVHVGGKRRFRLEDLKEFVERAVASPTNDRTSA